MANRSANDRQLMCVSVVAGPAVSALLNAVSSGDSGRRTGVLTSSKAGATGELAIFPLPTEATPGQVVAQITSIADKGAVDHLIIECEPDRPPMAYASLFATPDLAENLKDVSELSATAFVIRSVDLLDAILNRESNALPASLIAEQLEFVSDIFLQDNSNDRDSELARTVLHTLNPRARVFPLTQAAVDEWSEDRESAFDFDAALNGAGWRQLLDNEQRSSPGDKRIAAFGYRAWRPFHPERFSNLLQKDWRNVFRAKGFFWLATRMDEVGGLNLAGPDLHCAGAGTWWAAREETSRAAEMPERTRAEWKEPFGDRRQSFAVMALDVDRESLQSSLDACLLTDAEMSAGPGRWKEFSDPFPSWASHSHPDHHHDHECDHDHHDGPEEHDCCHH